MDSRRRLWQGLILATVVLGAVFSVAPAFGSAIVARNVQRPTLSIDQSGVAHVSYYQGGRRKTMAAWGAINARTPSRSVPQVRFHVRYGERGGGVCLPYDGPPLAWLVKACTAPDGSYWALQSWQRLKPNYGGVSGAWELHLSHWRGQVAQLVVYQNWVTRGIRHLFGRLTYGGAGVFGFDSTLQGNPLDSYGRNIYVDAYDSGLGKGWHRANGFLTHHKGRTRGSFCYGFYPHDGHRAGRGTKYRATAVGPGVTPDVMWQANDIGAYNRRTQHQMRRLERSWGDPKCRK